MNTRVLKQISHNAIIYRSIGISLLVTMIYVVLQYYVSHDKISQLLIGKTNASYVELEVAIATTFMCIVAESIIEKHEISSRSDAERTKKMLGVSDTFKRVGWTKYLAVALILLNIILRFNDISTTLLIAELSFLWVNANLTKYLLGDMRDHDVLSSLMTGKNYLTIDKMFRTYFKKKAGFMDNNSSLEQINQLLNRDDKKLEKFNSDLNSVVVDTELSDLKHFLRHSLITSNMGYAPFYMVINYTSIVILMLVGLTTHNSNSAFILLMVIILFSLTLYTTFNISILEEIRLYDTDLVDSGVKDDNVVTDGLFVLDSGTALKGRDRYELDFSFKLWSLIREDYLYKDEES